MGNDNVIPIGGKVDPEVQADRDAAIELARQVEAGEVKTTPFIAPDHLRTMEEVLAFVGLAQEETDMASIVSILETAHAAAARIMEEELRK